MLKPSSVIEVDTNHGVVKMSGSRWVDARFDQSFLTHSKCLLRSNMCLGRLVPSTPVDRGTLSC